MPEQDTAATGVELAPFHPPNVPMASSSVSALTDSEINRLFRVAQALAASRLFKDVANAEKAFAKLIIGRDLGLSPAQSLALYAMDGKVEVPYHMLGAFVRARPGYEYEIEWQEANGTVTGVAVKFSVFGEERGVSTFTLDDAERAGLKRSGGNYEKYPRNMLLARAMSNGCRWYVPEVLGGLPVYAEGELPRTEALGAGEGDGQGPGWGTLPIPLVAEVERVIRQAERLGHASLSNRESIQLQLSGRTPQAVVVWLEEAREDLAAMRPKPEPAIVAPEAPSAASAAQGEPEAVSGPVEPEPAGDAPETASDDPAYTAARLAHAKRAAAGAQTEEEFDAASAEVERLTALAEQQSLDV